MSERRGELTKFETIESIDEWESKVHDILKHDIAINKSIFNFPTYFEVENLKTLTKEFETYIHQSQYCPFYYIRLFNHLAKVRPKYSNEIIKTLYQTILDLFPYEKENMKTRLKDNIDYRLLYIICYPEEENPKEDDETLKVFTLLQNDDEKGFISFLCQNPKFDINKDIELKLRSYYSCITGWKTSITPIDFCCMFGSIKCFKYLYLNKCEITDITLEYAIKGGCEEIINILEEKHKFNKCLKAAVYYHHNNIIEWLLMKYGEDECDHVPLPICLYYYNYEAFLFFLHNGADINERDDDGETVLHMSSQIGNLSLVKYLIEEAHIDKEAKDENRETALHYASKWNCLAIVEISGTPSSDSERGWPDIISFSRLLRFWWL